jgi:hypothetical protein
MVHSLNLGHRRAIRPSFSKNGGVYTGPPGDLAERNVNFATSPTRRNHEHRRGPHSEGSGRPLGVGDAGYRPLSTGPELVGVPRAVPPGGGPAGASQAERADVRLMRRRRLQGHLKVSTMNAIPLDVSRLTASRRPASELPQPLHVKGSCGGLHGGELVRPRYWLSSIAIVTGTGDLLLSAPGYRPAPFV